MIILYYIALVLFAIFGVVNFLYLWVSSGKYPRGYWRQTAVNIDKFGNREFRALWNGALITSQSVHKFGKEGETISEVLGHNYVDSTLSAYGEVTVFLLSPKHCLDAAGFPTKPHRWDRVLVRVCGWLIFPLLYLFATPQKLRIAFFGVLMGVFGWLTNHTIEAYPLYVGMAFVFLFVIDLLWLIIRSL